MRHRIVRHARGRAGDLVPHELNARRHPEAQRLRAAGGVRADELLASFNTMRDERRPYQNDFVKMMVPRRNCQGSFTDTKQPH